jgi:Glutaminase A six helical-hairpin domain
MADDGDQYRLAFDKPGTWSQKYNLVWDKILGFKLFPAEVARKEMAFYKKSQLAFGLPLDNRRTYTKLDWILWTATLAETPADFAAFLDPVYEWLNKTPSRVPLTDWYYTDSGQAGRLPGAVRRRRSPDQDARRQDRQEVTVRLSPSRARSAEY